MRFKRRTGKGIRKMKRRVFRKIKKAKKKVANEVLTISGKYMIKCQATIQSLGSDAWIYFQKWNYNDILSQIRTNSNQFHILSSAYEFVRLVSAKIKILGNINPLRSESTFGSSAIAVDPKPVNAFTTATAGIITMANGHKFCKIRSLGQNNSMKIRAIPYNCNQTDMAIWQNAEGTSWYTDSKSGLAPPEYRAVIEVSSATFKYDSTVAYLEMSYKVQFKNIKNHN